MGRRGLLTAPQRSSEIVGVNNAIALTTPESSGQLASRRAIRLVSTHILAALFP
jgi:hypothetical protein